MVFLPRHIKGLPYPEHEGQPSEVAPYPATDPHVYLLDMQWPEFDKWLSTQVQPRDLVLTPLNGLVRKHPHYSWSFLQPQDLTHAPRVIEYPLLTLLRSQIFHWIRPRHGAAQQKQRFALDALFARFYAKQIPPRTSHLTVPITFLPTLFKLGVLQDRHVTVLLNRAPLALLQRNLDRGAALYPASPTLIDYRADQALLECEQRALADAKRLVTPHCEVAAHCSKHYPADMILLDWQINRSTQSPHSGRRILFPAHALGRKGAFEVRFACQSLGLDVAVLGRHSEWGTFWQGVRISSAEPDNLFNDICCVVLPAYVEHRPVILIRALELGYPVICSPECGIPNHIPGIITVSAGDSIGLVRALQVFQQPRIAPMA